MAEYDYDYIVIGGGSGGVRSARIAASYGAKVAIFENKKWGGTCVNVGCVPKKLFVYGSRFSEAPVNAAAFGWKLGDAEFSWKTLIENKNREIVRLNNIYKKLLSKCDMIEETASFVDAHTVEAAGKKYTGKYILVATGSTPVVPDVPGKEHIIVSDNCFFLEDLPKRILINGGGYIGVEFANIFNGFGVEVTQIYRGELFLRGFELECRELLAQEMRSHGIDLRFNCNFVQITKNSDGSFAAELNDGSTITTDMVMAATGREPLVERLNLQNAGIVQGKGGKIVADEWSKTNIENIYAIGDVIGKVALTPVAINEGHALADTLFGNKPRAMDYKTIPTAVFSQPAIGHCGLLESEAREEYKEVDIYKSQFTPMKYTLGGVKHKTFYKLIVERSSQKIVGAHVLDSDAGEVIQLLGVAIKGGLTKQDFDSTVGVHPTSAEELVTMRTKEPDPVSI